LFISLGLLADWIMESPAYIKCGLYASGQDHRRWDGEANPAGG